MALNWLSASCLAAVITVTFGNIDVCLDSDGQEKSVGDKWEEGVNLCECTYPQFLIFEGTPESTDAVRHCLINGCPAHGCSTSEVVNEGEIFQYGRDECVCVKGTSPFLADAWTLYHGQCVNAAGEEYFYTFDY